MENRNNKSFENIYQEANHGITNRDKIELMTDFINKMKKLIHQGYFLIEELEKEIK